jgi:hypothetical protein
MGFKKPSGSDEVKIRIRLLRQEEEEEDITVL